MRDKTKEEPITSFKGKFHFLSNFYFSPFIYEKRTFNTVEHGFQCHKTKDSMWRSLITNAQSPGQAKRIGRTCPLRSNWEEIKEDIMMAMLRAKFSEPEMEQKLLATYERELIEGNTWGDVYWGKDLHSGRGKNRLGILLMKLRTELRKKRIHDGA